MKRGVQSLSQRYLSQMLICRLAAKMAFALSSSSASTAFQSLTSLHSSDGLHLRPSNLLLPRHSLATSTLAFSRRRNHNSTVTSSSKKKKVNACLQYQLLTALGLRLQLLLLLQLWQIPMLFLCVFVLIVRFVE